MRMGSAIDLERHYSEIALSVMFFAGGGRRRQSRVPREPAEITSELGFVSRRNRQCGRKLGGRLDAQSFAATGLAPLKNNVALRYPEGFREEFDQMGIGLAIDRRRGNADLELSVMRADEFVNRGFWLQSTVQQQVFTLPLAPGKSIHGSGNAIELEQGFQGLQQQ